jgi:hypothetical protein
MKKSVEKISELEILESFPIKGDVQGWYFRTTETSNGAWFAEGSDQWGRIVSATGGDPEQLLKDLSLQARKIHESTKNT